MRIEFWLTAAMALALVCVSGSAGYYFGRLEGYHAGWLVGWKARGEE